MELYYELYSYKRNYYSSIFIVNFEQIPRIVLVFSLLILNK